MNQYSKYSTGNLPENAPDESLKWYESFFSAAGQVGAAYVDTHSPEYLAEQEAEKQKTRLKLVVIIAVVIAIASLIYFKTKK